MTIYRCPVQKRISQTTSGPCKVAAALCLEHPDSLTIELRTWLAKSKIKFTAMPVLSIQIYKLSLKEDFKKF